MGTSRERVALIGVLALVLVTAGVSVATASARADASAAGGTSAGVATIGATTLAVSAADPATTDDASLDAGFATLALQALGADPEQGADRAPGLGRRGPLMRFARGERLHRLVHAEVTIDRPDDGMVTLAVDHGTVTSVGNGNMAVKRADGATVTLATNDDTKVRIARTKADLADVKAGDELLVQSRTTGDAWTAERIFVIPPDTAGDANR